MRLLIVDDERDLAGELAATMRDRGWVVDVAHDGHHGLALARYGGYDVVLLDIMLPGLNGYAVLQRLRESDTRTAVVMLSAKDGEFDQSDAFEFGADDYVTKPFSVVVLAARLQAVLRRSGTPQALRLECGNLVVEPMARRVERGGVGIDLTPREFALLHHFMRHAGEVVSKADLLDAVWDSDYPGADNVVEVYVGYLRRKIDAPFGVQSVETVRGMGYRLVPAVTPGR
ncbi:MAG: response regulator transcription factor [Dermatophilaceae bacterium]